MLNWLRPQKLPETHCASVLSQVERKLGSGATHVLNIGARWGDDGAWWRITPLAGVLGFEPDPIECERLNQEAKARVGLHAVERYWPYALGAKPGAATLYQTQIAACSSLYPPMPELPSRYPQLSAIEKVGEQSVELTTLDRWWAENGQPVVHFMKLDTQGSELDILQGATQVLAGCGGLEVEVEFSALYENQPLFADVDKFLRAEGFVLWGLRDLCHYSENPESPGVGRLYWANAVYFRDYRQVQNATDCALLAVWLEAYGDHVAAHSSFKRSEL